MASTRDFSVARSSSPASTLDTEDLGAAAHNVLFKDARGVPVLAQKLGRDELNGVAQRMTTTPAHHSVAVRREDAIATMRGESVRPTSTSRANRPPRSSTSSSSATSPTGAGGGGGTRLPAIPSRSSSAEPMFGPPKVGPSSYCPQRHRHALEPSFLKLNGIL